MRGGLTWIFCGCLVLLTIRYVDASIRSLEVASSPGDDFLWFIVSAVNASLLFLLHALCSSRVAAYIWTSTYGIAVIAMLILSHSVLPFIAAAWVTVVCIATGSAIVNWLVRDVRSPLEQIACGLPLGFGVLALSVLVLGLAHLLTAFWIWMVLVGATAFCCVVMFRAAAIPRPGMFYKGFEQLCNASNETGVLLSVLTFSAFLNLMWAVAPEIQWDALNYHLAVPKLYLHYSKVLEIEFFHAYFARLVEMIFTICLAIGGPETVKLFVFLVVLGAALSVFALGRLLFSSRVGLWACALFYTTPLVGWLSGTAYIDGIIAFFVASSFIALALWYASENAGWLYIAALTLGLAVGSKPNSGFAFVVVVPVVVLRVLRDRRKLLRSRLKVIGFTAAVVSVMALPTYALTYWFTGNPVFPLFNGVFHSEKGAFSNVIPFADRVGIGHAPSSLVRLPFWMTLATARFGVPQCGLGVGLALAFPFSAWLLRRYRGAAVLLLTSVLVHFLLLAYTMQYARFVVPILPGAILLGVATAFYLVNRYTFVVSVCLLVTIVMQLCVSSSQYWNIPERFPVSVAFGTEPRDAFLGRVLSGYRSAMYLNAVTGPDDKVLGVNSSESVRFYVNANLETMPLALLQDPIRKLSDLPPTEELAQAMKRLGYRHIFAAQRELQIAAPWFPYLNGDFLNLFAKLEFIDSGTSVYVLRE
jgi:hypothetical protein